MSYPHDIKKTILSERARLGVKLSRGGRGNSTNRSGNSELSKLKKENASFKRKIKALKKLSDTEAEDDDNENSEEEADKDAGDQFCGKNSKKKAKNEA